MKIPDMVLVISEKKPPDDLCNEHNIVAHCAKYGYLDDFGGREL